MADGKKEIVREREREIERGRGSEVRERGSDGERAAPLSIEPAEFCTR